MREFDCEHAAVCGGCKYRDLTYEEQLMKKAAETEALFAEWMMPGGFLAPLSSPRQEGYRNKMEFTFGNECRDGELTLGLHQRKSFHNIIPVTDCKICDQDFRSILKSTMNYFRGCGTSFYHRKRHTGYLRHLVVRKAEKTGEILVCLVTTTEPQEEGLLEGWKEQLLALSLEGSFAGILHTKNDRLADAVVDEGTEILYGSGFFTETILGHNFRITPFSFFQTNSSGAEVLYQCGKNFLESVFDPAGKVIFDLYSGTGTIAQILSENASLVVGIELIPEAVEAARDNAALNGITNCRFLCGDVLKELGNVPELPDALILDPPRSGLHPGALKKILSYGVENILYISCKPQSLAQEMPAFHHAGYRMKKARCVDMFPFTGNIEAVVLLGKNVTRSKSHVDLGLDVEDYYRIKDSEKNDR